jgi:regulator of RNase E activity RraB
MDRSAALFGHFERNQELLRIFKEKLVDIEEPRTIEIHFWATNQANAARLASELYRMGFTLLLLQPAQTSEGTELWNIEASTFASISYVASEHFTTALTNLAVHLSVEYDGWGTSV